MSIKLWVFAVYIDVVSIDTVDVRTIKVPALSRTMSTNFLFECWEIFVYEGNGITFRFKSYTLAVFNLIFDLVRFLF